MENRTSADELRELLYLACPDAPASARASTAAMIIASGDQRLSERDVNRAVAALSEAAQTDRQARPASSTPAFALLSRHKADAFSASTHVTAGLRDLFRALGAPGGGSSPLPSGTGGVGL